MLYVTVIICSVYGFAIGATLLGLRRSGAAVATLPNSRPDAVVIVAAHNEASCIGACVRALLEQDVADLPVVVVDDGSSDGSVAEAHRAANGDPRLRVLSVSRRGKKRAVMAGIEATTAGRLLFTDADCVPPPGWAGAMLGALEQADFVAGYAPLVPRTTLLGKVAALEAAANAVTAEAMVGLGNPLMCSARSMGYSRRAYEEAGGLEPHLHEPSGDDTLMMQAVHRSGGRVRYVPQPAVPGRGPSTLAEWTRQKRRHLSTWRRFSIPATVAGLVVRSMDVLVVLGVPAALLGLVGAAPLWAFGFKVVVDGAGLTWGLGRLGERSLLTALPLLELVHSPLVLVSAVRGAFGVPPWK
ncbi:MAG: glycosyltransferase [Rhodothermales bacterium]|nr:glycosyltransferase [Rhodothermales bacterium]MBO6778971.1 glycosyltransferase [Rhodothermales bacterium]